MPANMKSNRVDLSDIAYITEGDANRLSKYIVKKDDIVYSRRGDVTLKALIREKEDGYFCGTGCLLLRPGDKFDSRFLTHYLSTPTIQNWIVRQAVGATMPNLNTGILASIPFNGPKKEEQEKIADVLSVIEDKIELNNRINSELEAMAKTLYDYWFVQFDFPDA
ncbi:restriction endonuclease subunit S, partial [Vibrio cholerae]